MEQIITSIEELNSFLRSEKLQEYQLRLSIPFLNDEENYRYSEIINSNKGACGCDTGGYFLLAAVLTCLLFSICKFAIFDTSIIRQISISVMIIFASSLIGKFFGISLSKIKTISAKHSINKIVQQRQHGNAS